MFTPVGVKPFLPRNQKVVLSLSFVAEIETKIAPLRFKHPTANYWISWYMAADWGIKRPESFKIYRATLIPIEDCSLVNLFNPFNKIQVAGVETKIWTPDSCLLNEQV